MCRKRKEGGRGGGGGLGGRGGDKSRFFVIDGSDCGMMMECVQHIFSQASALSFQHHLTGTG